MSLPLDAMKTVIAVHTNLVMPWKQQWMFYKPIDALKTVCM